VTFWCGSGSGSGPADPCLGLIDPDSDPDPDADPDPAIFVIDLQHANKKLIITKFFCLLLLHLHFFKDKKPKRSHKAVGIEAFITIFAW
jgi:hypothetical protein